MEEMQLQSLLHTVVETTDDVVFVKDLSGRHLLVNAAAARLLGCSPGEALGTTVADLFPADVAARLEADDRQVLESGQPLTVEERLPHAGSTRVYLTRKVPYRDTGGKVAGLLGIGHDITGRRRADASLHRQARALEERIKELTCFYGISALMETPGVTLTEILQGSVDLLPPAWLHPEVACARICLDDQEFRSEGFRDGPWRLAADLIVRSQRRGVVEVCYLEERAAADEGPFLREERTLLSAIAELLGRVITRFRVTEALASTNQLLEAILDHTHVLVAVMDTEFNFVRVNRAYAAADQRDTSFFPWKNHFGLYPNAENERIFRHVVETGEPCVVHARPFEYIEHPERGVSHWDWSLVPICDSEGAIEGLLLTLADVTDRIEAQKALLESEERFRQLAENVRDAFWLASTGDERQLLYVNPAFEKVFGIKIGDTLDSDQAWLDILHPHDRERTLQALGDFVLERANSYDVEYRIVHPDGLTRWVWDRRFAVRDDRGRFIRMAGLAVDITARKTIEADLNSHRRELGRRVEELTAIHESSRSLQQLHTPRALAQAVIAALEGTLAYEHGAVLLKVEDTGELVPFALSDQGRGPESVKADRAFLASRQLRVGKGITGMVAETGQSVRVGDVRQDARYLEVRDDIHSELCVPLRFGDRILGVVNVETTQPDAYSEADQRVLETVATNIAVAQQTADLYAQVQHQAANLEERVVERTAEAEILREVDRLRSELIANVSHEIRTPLGLIDVLSTSLLMDDVSFDREVQREFLLGIKEETDRLRVIVENLLDLGRVDSGRLLLHRQAVDLTELVGEVVAGMAADLASHSLELDLEGRDLVATVDAGQLERVLVNLLSNAVKYSPAGSTIGIDGHAAGGRVVIRVSDEGVGIPQVEHERIFERFYRVENETTRKVGGVGLGLAVCRSIVQAHKGRIWVESEPVKGSSFYVSLPVGAASIEGVD